MGGGGGGGSNNKKDHAAGKNPRCPLSFLFFFVLFQNTFKIDFFCRIWSKMCPQKRTKKIMIFVFFDLLCSFLFFFCCFFRIWLTKCPQTENKKEQKRSCRRENRKMSFVFFVVGPPPPFIYLLFKTSSLFRINIVPGSSSRYVVLSSAHFPYPLAVDRFFAVHAGC